MSACQGRAGQSVEEGRQLWVRYVLSERDQENINAGEDTILEMLMGVKQNSFPIFIRKFSVE